MSLASWPRSVAEEYAPYMPPKKTLYGGETKKAVENFPISGETVPASVIHWLGRIKGAAATVNAARFILPPAVMVVTL